MSDSTRAVREEDTFDVGAADRWLREHSGADLPAGEPEVRQFAGGSSNLTYLLRYDGRELILRRPPSGTKARGAHDMGREHRIQSALAPVFPYVPAMVGYCSDESVIGSEFYVMERIAGTVPHHDLGVDLPPEQVGQLCRTVIDILVELHQVDVAAAGLADLGKGAGYVERQIGGWTNRYRKARTWNVPRFEKVMAWLDRNRPEDVATCLIHNDYRFDNVVLAADDPLRVAGVLDWELATIGDPLMDLGSSMAYWVQADDDWAFRRFRRQPTHLPGMMTRAEVVDYYCERIGLKPDSWTFYEVYGLFRLAAIVQQIYYRYHHKQTRNPAFKNLWLPVIMLERRCTRLIARSNRR